MDTNFEKVISFLKENTNCDMADVSESTRLIEDLGMNSLELMTMANDAEADFNIVITDDDLKNIVTLGDIVSLLDSKL